MSSPRAVARINALAKLWAKAKPFAFLAQARGPRSCNKTASFRVGFMGM